MSGGLDALALKEDDVTKFLACGTHLGATNVDFQMEQYVFKRKPDGTYRQTLLLMSGPFYVNTNKGADQAFKSGCNCSIEYVCYSNLVLRIISHNGMDLNFIRTFHCQKCHDVICTVKSFLHKSGIIFTYMCNVLL